jgi:Protein of unknown function (DUF3168)
MTIASRIFTLLNGATAAGAKVYPMAAPDQTQAPFITYQRVSAVSENVLDGSNVSLLNTHIQVDIFSTSYAQAQAIFSDVDLLLMGGFDQVTSVQNQDIYEAEVDLYRVLSEYSIWHSS